MPAGLLLLVAAALSPEAALVAEINALRRNPAAYAKHLESLSQSFDGRILRMPGETPLQTKEGVAAVREAIQALKRARPAPPLAGSKALTELSRRQASVQGPTGMIGHQRVTPADMKKLGLSGWGQNVTYGPSDPRRVIIEQLVDDGVPDRGHRRNLLDPRFTLAGTGCAPHRVYGHVCVINLGAGAH